MSYNFDQCVCDYCFKHYFMTKNLTSEQIPKIIGNITTEKLKFEELLTMSDIEINKIVNYNQSCSVECKKIFLENKIRDCAWWIAYLETLILLQKTT